MENQSYMQLNVGNTYRYMLGNICIYTGLHCCIYIEALDPDICVQVGLGSRLQVEYLPLDFVEVRGRIKFQTTKKINCHCHSFLLNRVQVGLQLPELHVNYNPKRIPICFEELGLERLHNAESLYIYKS